MIRKALPTILEGNNIDSHLLTTAGADRSKDDAISALLRFPNDKKSTMWAPLLFPDSTKDMIRVFTGPVVKRVSDYILFFQLSDGDSDKVHRLMYFGPSSLIPGNSLAANSNGVRLGFREVTESSVSTAAILVCRHLITGIIVDPKFKARFVLSPDKEWASKGAISGTEWEKDYRAYHKMLACNRHMPHVKKIFEEIHAFVFTGSVTSSTGDANADGDSGVEDEILDAMRRFELGTDATDDNARHAGGTMDHAAPVDDGVPMPPEKSAATGQVDAHLRIGGMPQEDTEVEERPSRQRTRRNTATATAGKTSGAVTRKRR